MEVVILHGHKHVGKTSVLNLLYDKVKSNGYAEIAPKESAIDFLKRIKLPSINVTRLEKEIVKGAKGNIGNDFNAQFSVNGKSVCIFSMGDYATVLKYVLKFTVDVVVIAYNDNFLPLSRYIKPLPNPLNVFSQSASSSPFVSDNERKRDDIFDRIIDLTK